MKHFNFSHFRLRKLMNLPDTITVLNLTFGIIAIFLAIQGKLLGASLAIFAALVFDTIDGKVARWLNSRSEFGGQLDSLSDLVSFGVAPLVLSTIYLDISIPNSNFFPIHIIAGIIFVTCGMFRLARYNIMNYKHGFVGLPITTNGIIIPLLCLFNFPPNYLWIPLLILAYLMISNIKIKRFI